MVGVFGAMGVAFFLVAGLSFLFQGLAWGSVQSRATRPIYRRMWLFFALPGVASIALALLAAIGLPSVVIWLLSAPGSGGLYPFQAVLLTAYFAAVVLLILVGPRALWGGITRMRRRDR
jgi:hypothetical protein